MPEAKAKEKPSQAPQAQAPSQYVPDKTLRRVAIEKADKSEENKK